MDQRVVNDCSERARMRTARRLRCRLVLAVLCAACAAAPVARALETRRVTRGDDGFVLVELDLPRDQLELRWQDGDGHALSSIEGLRAWGQKHGRELLFATNAGIYDQQLRPLGLHIEDGATWRRLNTVRLPGTIGNFSMQPNGVFHVDRDGKAGVMTTAQWQQAPPAARIASQSGPMLLVDGQINPTFDAGSQSRKIRSGVCAPTPQRVVFAISQTPVSFHRFAQMMRDEVHCRDALFLDGSLSQIWTRADGYVGAPAPMLKPYVGMFAVFADPAP